MRLPTMLLAAFLAAFLAAPTIAAPAPAPPPRTPAPAAPVDLLALDLVKDFTAHLNPKNSIHGDPATAFQKTELQGTPVLDVSGGGWGYLRTNESWQNYHLVVEYRWGERTWGHRSDRARDCGIFVHANGNDGALGNSWIPAFEVQLIEGGSGNIAVVASSDAPSHTLETAGGTMLPSAEHGRKAPASYVDENWTDVRGYRGGDDIENPVGDWNRLEIIARDDHLDVILNGEQVNEVTALSPHSGHIAIQSEGAELLIRRFELHALDTFEEVWQSGAAITKTGTGLLPRATPLSPEESLAAIEIDGPWTLELVAAEPLVCDPVDVAFDEQGRIFVAEMRDYQDLEDEEDAGPHLSRIRLLTDTDGDGKIDTSTVWADELDHVQGLCRMKGGFLATTRTAVLFLADTDGDDIADQREVLYHSNRPRHAQIAVSSPRWGPDNAIYLNNGLDGKEIYPHGDPDHPLKFERRNLRLDPYDKNPKTRLTLVTGRGQYGATFDDWGRHFYCSNRNPAMMTLMPLDTLGRNPYFPIAQGYDDIAPSGGAAKVYPLTLTHTTATFHAGSHTAACGLAVSRGDLLPDLQGNLFVCEPPGQLVTRSRLVPAGASLRAERIGDKTEFIASTDEWFRPVNLRNGPDGALWLCDMQRRFIDHARFFSEQFSQEHYMRAGFDQGRLYRLVPDGEGDVPATTDRPLPDAPADLVNLLGHENAWHRIHAQRRLVEIGDPSVAPRLRELYEDESNPLARSHALWTLIGLPGGSEYAVDFAIGDPTPLLETMFAYDVFAKGGGCARSDALETVMKHPSARLRALALCILGDPADKGTVRAAIEAARQEPADLWTQNAVLSVAGDSAATILAALLPELEPESVTLVRHLARSAGARGHIDDLRSILSAKESDRADWASFALLKGLGEGLRKCKNGPLKAYTLTKLLSAPPEQLAPFVPAIKATLERAHTLAVDPSRPAADRVAALPLLESLPFAEAVTALDQLLVSTESAAIQRAAFAILRTQNRTQAAEYLFAKWPELGPVAQEEATALVTSSNATAKELLNKIKAGDISPAVLNVELRWRYGRSTDPELKSLADELFGQPSADRAAVLTDYRDALSLEGDAAAGHVVFTQTCAVCHKIDGEGVDVAPDISDVRIKTPDALLSDILDPNRVVETRWTAVAAETTDGRSLSGIIDNEDAASVTLKLQGGLAQAIPRNEIKSLKSLNQSLMPIGLEAVISKQQMADLLAFLKNR